MQKEATAPAAAAAAPAASAPLAPFSTTAANPPEAIASPPPSPADVNAEKQADLIEKTRQMFNNLGEYLKGELTITSEDYRLLENMNRLATDKYREMNTNAAGIVTLLTEIQARYEEFKPYLAQIDQIEKSVGDLEQTVSTLNDYSKRLEDKFKNIEKEATRKEDVK